MVTTLRAPTCATPVDERFDEPGLTPFGGAGPWLDFALNVLGLGTAVERGFGDAKPKQSSYTLGFQVLLFLLTRPLGLIRPDHFDDVGDDPMLRTKLQASQLPSAATQNRALHRLATEPFRNELRQLHRQLLAPALLAPGAPDYAILDVDSTVNVVHGRHIDQADIGYNPGLRGRRSYKPLLLTEGHRDLVLGACLRPGSAHDTRDLAEQYCDLRDWLAGLGRPIRFFRADRGFRGERTYAMLEQDGVGYTIKATKTKEILKKLYDVPYTPIGAKHGVYRAEATSFTVQLADWSRPRRVVVIRQCVWDPTDRQRALWGPQWRYEVIITNLDWDEGAIWRFYNRRCQAENLIKELKEGYGLDKVSTASFGANDADLVLKVLSHTLIWRFRHQVLPKNWRGLRLLKLQRLLLQIPGVLRRHARQWSVRLPATYPHRGERLQIRHRLMVLQT